MQEGDLLITSSFQNVLEAGVRMYSQLLKVHFRKFRVIEDEKIYRFSLMVVIVLTILVSIFISIFLRDPLLTIIISFFLSQHNIPLFTKMISQLNTMHYTYKKNVLGRYIIYQLLNHNILIIPLFIFLFIESIVSFFKGFYNDISHINFNFTVYKLDFNKTYF